MKTQRDENTAPVLIDVKEAARRLGTEPRFVRRLIAERRIEFHKLGRYVRISEAALADFIKAGRVEPLTAVDAQHKVRERHYAEQERTPTFRQCQETGIRPFPDPLPGAGRAHADRS